jgi:hypothetical protein
MFGETAANGAIENVAARDRKSVAPALLAAALALFILEAILTLAFARQRRVRHGAVVLTPVTMR